MSQYKMRISAKGYFFTADNKILLIRGQSEFNGKPFWCAPGGGVEEGESLFAAVEREVMEETGYFGKAEKIVFAQDYKHDENERNLEIFIYGKIDESRPPNPDYDHEEFRFVSREEFEAITYLPEGINPFLMSGNNAGYRTYLGELEA